MASRMPRVQTYHDQFGSPHDNTGPHLIPFTLMTHVGDWCEVKRGPSCLAGNVASICSAYSLKLGRRFKFRDLGDGTYRITVTDDPVAGSVTFAVTEFRQVPGLVTL